MKKFISIIITGIIMFGCQKSINKKDTLKNTTLLDSILIFDKFDYPKINAIEFVTKEWNIYSSIIPIALPIEQVDSIYQMQKIKKESSRIELINAPVWKKLDSIYGIDSKKKFNQDIVGELSRINNGQNILDSDSLVQVFLKKTYSKGAFVKPVVKSKYSDSVYVWKMWKIDEIGVESYNNKPYAIFKVNINNGLVRIQEGFK